MLDSVKRAVFFGAHTDDEMVCAGTLRRLVRQGAEVHVVTFAPAAIETDRTGGVPSLDVVGQEWENAMRLIGVKEDHRRLIGLTPSADLHPFKQLIRQYVYDYVTGVKPDLCVVLSPEDENPAHAVVGTECEAVMRGRVPITLRCVFPWNYGHGRSNVFVRLTGEDVDVKGEVAKAYKSQTFRYQYGALLYHYCRADGLSVKQEFTEKFELVRAVV